jgi:hypothetical protein
LGCFEGSKSKKEPNINDLRAFFLIDIAFEFFDGADNDVAASSGPASDFCIEDTWMSE